jgi:hypothetical protein
MSFSMGAALTFISAFHLVLFVWCSNDTVFGLRGHSERAKEKEKKKQRRLDEENRPGTGTTEKSIISDVMPLHIQSEYCGRLPCIVDLTHAEQTPFNDSPNSVISLSPKSPYIWKPIAESRDALSLSIFESITIADLTKPSPNIPIIKVEPSYSHNHRLPCLRQTPPLYRMSTSTVLTASNFATQPRLSNYRGSSLVRSQSPLQQAMTSTRLQCPALMQPASSPNLHDDTEGDITALPQRNPRSPGSSISGHFRIMRKSRLRNVESTTSGWFPFA